MISSPERPNIVLITVDCLRADSFVRLIENGGLQSLSQLFKNGLICKRCYAPSTSTPASFSSIFSSTFPLMYGGQLHLRSRSSFVYELRRRGYLTIGVHSNPWLTPLQGYNKGFVHFEYLNPKERIIDRNRFLSFGTRLLLGRRAFAVSDKLINRKIADVLRKQSFESPLFLWVHYMGVHDPYLSLSRANVFENVKLWNLNRGWHKYRDLSKEQISQLKGLYDEQIKRVGERIRELLTFLNELIDMDTTYIILTSDHGQGFLEHGQLGHGFLVYEEVIRVPLIIASSHFQQGESSAPLSLIDLGPTILDIAGAEPMAGSVGHSLLSANGSMFRTNASRPVFVESTLEHFTEITRPNLVTPSFPHRKLIIACIDGFLKYIYSSTVSDELYDLKTDCSEAINLCNHHVRANSLREQVRRHLKFVTADRASRRTDAGYTREEQEELFRRLRDLGYV